VERRPAAEGVAAMIGLARLARWLLAAALPAGHRAVVLAHLDEEYAQRQTSSPRAAAWWLCRQALASLPGALQLRAQGRRDASMPSARAFRLAGSIAQDLRFAVRQVRRAPGFSLAAVLMLAIGLGLTAGTWTVINGIFLRGWNVPDSARVFRADAGVAGAPDGGRLRDGFSPRAVAHVRASAQRADYVAFLIEYFNASAQPGVDGALTPGLFVSDTFVEVLRIPLALGTGLSAPAATDEPRVVISHRLWTRIFAGDPGALGRHVWLQGVPAVVTGVTAPEFDGLAERPVEFMVELARAPRWPDTYGARVVGTDAGCCLMIAGRRRAGWDRRGVQQELVLLTAQYRHAAGQPELAITLRGTAFGDSPQLAAAVPQILTMLFAGVALVLLLTCANVGNLFLARSLRRRREIAVRMSLGAGRARVVGQLLMEGLLLAGFAGGAALLFTRAVPGIIALTGENAPAQLFAADWRVLAFTLAATLVVCLLVALTPALQASRRPDGRSSAVRAGRLRQWVLAVQIAVAAVLVLSAVLITRGIQQAASLRADFALHTTSAVTFRLPSDVANDAARLATVRAALLAVLAQGGFRAGLADKIPVSDDASSRTSIRPHGSSVDFRVELLPLSSAAFGVLDLGIVAGRLPSDDPAAAEAVVNETLARRVWPDRTALGRRVFLNYGDRDYTVVGIVRDAHLTSLSEIPPLIHVAPWVRPLPIVLARWSPDLWPRVRALAASVDPSLSVAVTPLAQSVRQTLRNARIGAAVAGALGAIALLLAVIGVFGVFAYLVEDRRREIGIRLALGATKRQVRLAMLHACRAPVIAGLAGGLGLSAIAAALLRGFLFGLSPADPVSAGVVAAMLLVAALGATAVPVRRALRVDPAITLRAE
jgi:predicted permease